MSKKGKNKNGKNTKKLSSGKDIEKEYSKLEKDITKTRGKMLKLLAKQAKMDVQDYVLKDKENNSVSLSQMFGNKKELIVIHNMGRSCGYCTMWADGFNGNYKHIERKASFALISPDAPDVQKAFASDRGWGFNMYSAEGSPFIKDMGYVTDAGSYWPGASVFHKEDDGKITRISKTFFGPGDFFCSVWHFYDMLPQNGEKAE